MGLTLETSKYFEKFLQDKTTTLPKVMDVVRTNTAEMQETAQRAAPVDTGFLKREIHQRLTDRGTSVVGEVFGDADYDPYQEYGTRYMTGKPHIRPAYYKQRNKFRQDMYRLVKK